MSLEEALHANTAALNKLADLLDLSVIKIPTVIGPLPPQPFVTAQAAVAENNTASSSPATPSPHGLDDAAVLEPAPAKEPEDVTKAQVAKAITHLANSQGRDVAVQVLALFGIKKVSEANPSDYPAILAACEGA